MADHSTLQVRFVNAETGVTLGETQLAAEELPQSFEAATTMELGDRTFQVVSATPMTAREFRATGTLRLELREIQVQSMDVRAILYSLPSINSAMPVMCLGGRVRVALGPHGRSRTRGAGRGPPGTHLAFSGRLRVPSPRGSPPCPKPSPALHPWSRRRSMWCLRPPRPR